MIRLRLWLLAAVLALGPAALLARGARAGALEVAPVLTDLAPGQSTATLTVTNRGTQTSAVQLRSFAWSQAGGEDRLTPTDELLVSPPLFELPPGAAQVVRLVLQSRPDGAERAFRLLVDEIPPATGRGATVRLALRLSLPVFARSSEQGAARLEWRIVAGRHLVATNRGTRRVRLADLALAAPGGGRIPLGSPANPYVLPGAERRWSLLRGGLRPGTAATLTGLSEAGPFRVDVPVTPGR